MYKEIIPTDGPPFQWIEYIELQVNQITGYIEENCTNQYFPVRIPQKTKETVMNKFDTDNK